MDKNEAYKILTTELESISCKSIEQFKDLVGNTIETEVFSDSGVHYSITVNIMKNVDGKYVLEGNIHNNSSFKYRLLEEKLIVQKQ